MRRLVASRWRRAPWSTIVLVSEGMVLPSHWFGGAAMHEVYEEELSGARQALESRVGQLRGVLRAPRAGACAVAANDLQAHGWALADARCRLASRRLARRRRSGCADAGLDPILPAAGG